MKSIYEKEFFSNIIKKSNNYREVCIALNLKKSGGSRETIRKYIELYGLDISHFHKVIYFNKNKIEDILIKDSTYGSTTHLKERLYKENMKERKCELCGQTEEWNGKKMSLILDHINGDNTDNRIENLRIVCPNCDATLETFCKGNRIFVKTEKIVKQKEKKIRKRYYCTCGKEIRRNSKICSECNSKNQRKIERPSLEQLLKDVEQLNYTGTARKYSVSDSSIRKWINYYKKNLMEV